MSAVPPNLVGPILQTPLVQRQVAAVRDAERAQGAIAQRQTAAAVDATDSTVETTDNDTQVHTESEGQGSQGRAFSEPDGEPTATEPPAPDGEQQEGRLIDLEA